MYEVRLEDIRRLEKEVKSYEAGKIEKGKILFYGDSAFTRWNTRFGNRSMEEDFLGADGTSAVVNHGFGTSTAEEQLYYYPRMVLPWEPRALVVQAYWNDTDLSYTPEEILFLQSRMLEYARRDMPGIRFYMCDVRPILKEKQKKGGWYYHQKEYNQLLTEYCARHGDCTLVSQIQDSRFFESGMPAGDFRYENFRKDIFIEDEVHYNQKGYDMYREFFKEALKDIL